MTTTTLRQRDDPEVWAYNSDRSNPEKDAPRILGRDRPSGELIEGFQKFVENEPLDRDIPEFLESFRSSSGPGKNLDCFLVGLNTGFKRESAYDEQYFDAPYSMVLIHNEGAIAAISFEPHPGALLVPQIQGVRRERAKLERLKWPKALLRLVTDFAEDYDIPEVWVLPSVKNKWTEVAGSDGGFLRYDVTARRSGFKYDEQKKVYVKDTFT